MSILEAIQARHSVRRYLDKPIAQSVIDALQAEIDACNKEGSLNIQLVTGEPKAFDGFMAHYGKFSGVQNYIALVGKKSADLEEKLGYYGERIALLAQTLELNTCWVAATVSKSTVKKNIQIGSGEKISLVISLGYGETQGTTRKSKLIEQLCYINGDMPDWFRNGMECVLLAPTATNQQKFLFSLDGNSVSAKSTGGFYSMVDLGIAKYHFEVGAGANNFSWK